MIKGIERKGQLATPTTIFAISRAFFCLFAGLGIHLSTIISLCFLVTVWAKNFVVVFFYEFVENLSTVFTFVFE